MERAENRCEVCGLGNGYQVFSWNIFVRMKGRYKLKTFWTQSRDEFIRIKPHVHSWKWVNVVLTISHLDHDETNHDVKDDRLKSMCQYCHLNYDAAEKMRRIMSKAEQIPSLPKTQID